MDMARWSRTNTLIASSRRGAARFPITLRHDHAIVLMVCVPQEVAAAAGDVHSVEESIHVRIVD